MPDSDAVPPQGPAGLLGARGVAETADVVGTGRVGEAKNAIGAADVEAARRRIDGFLRRTPVLGLSAGELGLQIDTPVFLKLDGQQVTGSFKARGAISLLTAAPVSDAGVVAASGGNFGLAIAWAARRLGIHATVITPASAPRAKLEPIRGYGADLVTVDGSYADALTEAGRRIAETGAIAAHAYDDPDVVAGQGSSIAELLEDAVVDTVLIACGGGGLLAGALAATEDSDVRVVAVETTTTATLHTALAVGHPVDVKVGGVAASALGARQIGSLMWAVRDRLAGSITVDDEAVRYAMRRLWESARLVAEPGGATALAALLSGAYRPSVGERVGVLLCGANTDPGAEETTPR